MSFSYEDMQRLLSNPNANLFGGPPSSGGFDPSGIQGLSLGGSQAPGFRNPFQYQSFGSSKGVGDYLGANAPLFSAGFQGLSQLGGLYLGLKNLSLAKQSFGLSKEAYKTNLANSTQSYNTQMQDRIAGRSYGSEEERQAALKAAQLPTPGSY